MVSICNFLPPPSPRVRRRVSYTISLTINLFTTNGKGNGKACFSPALQAEDCKEKIARNSCLSFYVLTECSQKFEPLRPVLLSLVA